jgi:hypothetical protein
MRYREDTDTGKESGAKKLVVEYDISARIDIPENYKTGNEREILPQILKHFTSGAVAIVDTYIVYGSLKENDYYGKDEPPNSTVVIIESDIMHTIYPDFSDYIDQILEESQRMLQDSNLYIECYWKIKALDIDVFVLSLRTDN